LASCDTSGPLEGADDLPSLANGSPRFENAASEKHDFSGADVTEQWRPIHVSRETPI
jgi:hypothetical protein